MRVCGYHVFVRLGVVRLTVSGVGAWDGFFVSILLASTKWLSERGLFFGGLRIIDTLIVRNLCQLLETLNGYTLAPIVKH